MEDSARRPFIVTLRLRPRGSIRKPLARVQHISTQNLANFSSTMTTPEPKLPLRMRYWNFYRVLTRRAPTWQNGIAKRSSEIPLQIPRYRSRKAAETFRDNKGAALICRRGPLA